MKKLIFSLVAIVASFGAQAITVGEAFDKIADLPGVAISEVPEHDCLKDGMDWGKVAMLMGAATSATDQFNTILAEITDEMTLETVAQGNNEVKAFTAKTESGRTQALVTVTMPQGIVAIYAQGDDDIVKDLNIN